MQMELSKAADTLKGVTGWRTAEAARNPCVYVEPSSLIADISISGTPGAPG